MARQLPQNHVHEFWKAVSHYYYSSMNWVSGDNIIAKLWGKHFEEIFNCAFKIDDVLTKSGVVITPDEVCHAIGKLTVYKVCGPDQITAEHLEYASRA